MIDDLARVAGRHVSRETFERLETYVGLLLEENSRQNLIARSTVDEVWQRHILDSAQLARFAPRQDSSWLDIGSGAGLPGLVIALLGAGATTLCEPRRLRAEFLQHCVETLDLESRVTVRTSKVEQLAGEFDVITARAVAPLNKLLRLAHPLSHAQTRWVLPKGRNAETELAAARRSWQCAAEMVPSVTDPESLILVLSGVRAKTR